MAKKVEKRLRIMVSSTVHGISSTLKQIYAQLEGYGYEVWMSDAGTIPNFFNHHPFTDCLEAVENCDLFFSLITPRYGSVVDDMEQFQSEDLSERQARRDLFELTRLGFLERFGSARSTRYKRTELKLP